ncbi:MAG: glycosyltransferase [Prevotellaceae bacterium]|jgi:glycosyltransferase involved in cell wall biosynthesis|nr:glycosyltransferase [Prevotellaceae bacterium]
MKKKLHILQLPSWYMPHGGQFVRNQAQALIEKGLTVNVLANIETSLRKDKLKYLTYPLQSKFTEEDGFVIYRNFLRVIPKFGKINIEMYVAKTLQMFKKYCEQFGAPDIIHVHSAIWAGYAAAKIKEKYGVPYIITEHRGVFGLSCEYAKQYFLDCYLPYLKVAISNADYLTPVSANQIPMLSSFSKNSIPIRPVSNVINTDFFYYKPRIHSSKKIKFVSVNGFRYVKGYDILLPAFDTACEKNKDIEITIVGENFEKRNFQKTLWKNVKNKDKFHFTGELSADGVREELWKADCYIMPSRSEGQPQATLEALCTGLPMVCTEVVPDNVAIKENSIRIPVENIERMTNAILNLSETYKSYDNKAISEYIIGICGKEAFSKAIIDVYKQVLTK